MFSAYIKSRNLLKKFSLVLNSLPEQDEVALLQNVGDVNDFLDCIVPHLGWQQEILAEDEIAERQICESFQQN